MEASVFKIAAAQVGVLKVRARELRALKVLPSEHDPWDECARQVERSVVRRSFSGPQARDRLDRERHVHPVANLVRLGREFIPVVVVGRRLTERK